MGVGQSVPNQSRSARLLAMGTSTPQVVTTGSSTTGNANSVQTTVRDHINKEFKSRDHTQHALYNLLSTGKATSHMNVGDMKTLNMDLAKESRDVNMDLVENKNGHSASGNDKAERDTENVKQNGPVSREECKANSVKCEEDVSAQTAPEAASDKPSSPTFLHPKKKMLYRQQQLHTTIPNQSKSSPSVASHTADQSVSSAPISVVTTSHVLGDIKNEGSSMMPSPPKSSETVKSCMEKIMEHMLHVCRADDQDREKTTHATKLRSQEHMIQEKIKQFLQEDPVSVETKKDGGLKRPSAQSSASAQRPEGTLAHREAKAGYAPTKKVASNGRDLTIAQRIHRDISQVLLDPTSDKLTMETRKASALPTQSGMLTSYSGNLATQAPTSRQGNVVVVQQSKADCVSTAVVHSNRDKSSPSYQENASREFPPRYGYWPSHPDGRSSAEAHSSDGRRSSTLYEKLREPLVLNNPRERNCSSTDTARSSETKDAEKNPYHRGRSQTISYPIKSPHRSSPYPNPSHHTSLSQSQLSTVMTPPGKASLYTGYHANHGVKEVQREARETLRDVMTSHYGSHDRAGASREAYTNNERTEAQLAAMFYQPHKPATTHGGSISAGLPRTSINDQRDDLLKEAYQLVTMPNRESHFESRRHDELIDRSRGEKVLPPLLHITNRLRVPGQDAPDSRNRPTGRPRSRSRSPIGLSTHPTQHPDYLNRHEESHADAPLDLSATSRSSPVNKPGTPHSRHADSRDQHVARDVKVSPLCPIVPIGYPGKAMVMAEQALKAAQVSSPSQIPFYPQEWLKHYRLPGLPLLPDASLAAAQLSAAQFLPPGFDPRALTSPTDPRMTSSSTSPRPSGEAEDREREYGMRTHPRLYREHSPNPSAPQRDVVDPRDPQSPGGLHAPIAMSSHSPSTLHLPGAAATSGMLSPHTRQPSPGSRDATKERIANRSIGPNLLGDFPPEDVLFLRCNLCRDTYGNVHSFIKHFSRDHASEGDPRPHHLMIQSISKAKHAIEVNHIPRPAEPRPLEPRGLDPWHLDRRYLESSTHYAGLSKPHSEQMMRSHDLWGTKEQPRADPRATSPSVMRCPKCPQEFSTRDWGMWKRHMKSHESGAKFTETAAPAAHESLRGDVVSHAQTRAQQTMVCDECHVSFQDNLEWHLHMSISHSNRTCVCRICNVGFGHIDAMYKHVYTAHNGLNGVEVEFNCLSCSKAFTNERSLIEHMKTKECGIDRNSIGSMISLSVRSRVRHQGVGVSMSPPLKRHRMTPDTTCSEDKPISTDTVPVTTMANSVAAPTPDPGATVHNTMESYAHSEFTVIDLIQQKVEQEHKRQITGVTAHDHSKQSESKKAIESPQGFKTNANPVSQDDKFMSPLKRRLLGYDKLDMDTTPVKHIKMDPNLIADRTSRSPSLVPKRNPQSIISSVVESTVLGRNMDVDTMYKRSIAKMITEESEREKREEEAIVKRDADSSFGKGDGQNVREDKNYQTSYKGDLQPLVENQSKKMFPKDESMTVEIKREPKKEQRFEDHFTPNIDRIIRSELEKSDTDDKMAVPSEHSAPIQVKSETTVEDANATKQSYSTNFQTADFKAENKSTQEVCPELSPMCAEGGKSDEAAPGANGDTDTSIQRGSRQAPDESNPGQSPHSRAERSGRVSSEALRHGDVSGSSDVLCDRLDSYEEGNLVICEDQTD